MSLKKIIYKLLPKRIKFFLSHSYFHDIINLPLNLRTKKLSKLPKSYSNILLYYCLLIVFVQMYFDLEPSDPKKPYNYNKKII